MRGRWVARLSWVALSAGAVAAAPPRDTAPLPGKIAYIRGGVACIAPARGGRELILPGSQGADSVYLSPAGDQVLYFVRHANVPPFDRYSALCRGYDSRAPFTRSTPLPAPFERSALARVVWTTGGDRAYLRAEKIEKGDGDGTYVERDGKSFTLHTFQGVYRPADGTFRLERHPVESLSRDGRVAAWEANFRRIEFRETATGAPISLFASERPEPVLTALRQARHPDRIRELLEVTETDRKNPQKWAVSPPALMPDGKRLFFAANAGAPSGASGNTDYCFFAADLRTKKLAVLSRLGVFGTSHLPDVCRVSPDGARLLIHFTAHSNFIEGPSSVYVVDLVSQESRELIGKDPLHQRDANLVAGAPVWSPDGRYVAVAVHYYRVTTGTEGGYQVRPWLPGRGYGKTVPANTWNDREADYEVQIFDAATGRRVRTLPNAVKPSWSR